MIFAIFTVMKCVCTEGAKAMVSKVICALCAFQCNDKISCPRFNTHARTHTHKHTYTCTCTCSWAYIHSVLLMDTLDEKEKKIHSLIESLSLHILVFNASVKYEAHMNLFSFTFLYNSGLGEGHQCDWGTDWPNYICYGKIFSCGRRIIIRYLVDIFLDMNTM